MVKRPYGWGGSLAGRHRIDAELRGTDDDVVFSSTDVGGKQVSHTRGAERAGRTIVADAAAWKADTHRSRQGRSLPEQAQGSRACVRPRG